MRNTLSKILRRVILSIDPNCDWCGGSGTWTDPKGVGWPCIKCNR